MENSIFLAPGTKNRLKHQKQNKIYEDLWTLNENPWQSASPQSQEFDTPDDDDADDDDDHHDHDHDHGGGDDDDDDTHYLTAPRIPPGQCPTVS